MPKKGSRGNKARDILVLLVLKKLDGRFLCFNNQGTIEFFEAQGKPVDVSWKDFVKIVLQNKYAFASETVEKIEVVEPLFAYENFVYVYAEIKRVRIDNKLFFSVSYPFQPNNKFFKHLDQKLEWFPTIVENLRMLGLWKDKK